MAALENLFAMRSYESVGSDYRFLELFSDKILDAIDPTALHNRVTIFRSGPGGGKTSLLQLFGPEPLRRICDNKDVNREVYARLRKLGVIDGGGPCVLSMYHRMDKYEALPGEADSGSMQSLYTLTGARLIMKWLSCILSLKGLGDDQMDRIRIGIPLSGKTLPGSPIPCSGRDLYEWAANTEKTICDAAGSLADLTVENVPMFRGLDHIHMMEPGHVTVGDEKVTARPMIALDDLHRLDDGQRKHLLEHVCEARYPAPVWLAERLDVLSLEDLFNGINGREYKPINLEAYWEDRGTAFESFARSISAKRTGGEGADFRIVPLPDHLDDALAPGLDGDVKAALKKIKDRVRTACRNKPRYSGWVGRVEDSEAAGALESLVSWKMLEIKMARYEAKGTVPLSEAPLGANAEGEIDNKTREAAEIMLGGEFGLPRYYGFGKIVALATFNVELFLELASDMMDRLVAQLLRDPGDRRINATEQEKIIKAVAGRHWDDIERMNANGRDIKRFLESFCRFAHGENKPNAPYAPGVTGFGIVPSEWEKIRDGLTKGHYRLNRVLHACLAQNYLKIKSVKQGNRGDNPKTILYLNRLLCAHAGLPVGRGGWRKKSSDELVEWLTGGEAAPGGGGLRQ